MMLQRSKAQWVFMVSGILMGWVVSFTLPLRVMSQEQASSSAELVYVQGGSEAEIVIDFLRRESTGSNITIAPSEIKVARFDLNSDGQEEIFASLGGIYCGASGCEFLVLEQEGETWISRLSLLGWVEPASTSTNGYQDLESETWGERFKAIRTFNGLTYDLSYFLDGSYRIMPMDFNSATLRSATFAYDQPLVEAVTDQQLEAGQPVFLRGQIDQWYMVTLTRMADPPFYLPKQVVVIGQ